MLLELKIENFMSFKDETIFSMERSNVDKSTLNNNVISFKDMNILKSSIILGPNASGKTNLIQALHFIKWIVINSRSFDREQKIKYFPFKLDPDYRMKKPISFRIRFVNNDNVYDYHIQIKKIEKKGSEYYFKILKEELKINSDMIFSRDRKDFDFPDHKIISESIKNISKMLIDNSLLLSAYASNDIPELKEAYDWFDKKLEISLEGGITKRHLIERFFDNGTFKKYLKNKMMISDLGNISNLDIIENEMKFDFPENMDQKVRELVTFDNKYRILTYHNDIDKEDIEFDFEMEESKGTQKYIFLIGQIYDMIREDKVFIIDELENSLHPELVKLVFQLVHGSDSRAQLIATTHSYSLLQYVNNESGEIFRRDQVWFARKRPNMSTQLYSLINIGGIRKDLRIFKAYFDGRLEAFPDIRMT